MLRVSFNWVNLCVFIEIKICHLVAMQVNDEPATWAAAGDSVLLTLINLDIMNLR